MSEPDAAYYKTKIGELLKRVPARINNGGHGTAVAYKEAVKYAQKYLTAPRATVMNLRQAHQKLIAYQD
jgi:hypothetical protein